MSKLRTLFRKNADGYTEGEIQVMSENRFEEVVHNLLLRFTRKLREIANETGDLDIDTRQGVSRIADEIESLNQ